MSQITFSPPFVRPSQVSEQLRSAGYAVLAPADVAAWAGCDLQALMALNADWNGLPPDEFLKDGGRYRRRRHSCFVVTGEEVQQVPHRPHWQPVEYNALHGVEPCSSTKPLPCTGQAAFLLICLVPGVACAAARHSGPALRVSSAAL